MMQQTNDKLISFWISKINDYLRENKMQIDPLPNIVIDNEKKNDGSDILISTGGYQPMTQTLFLYVNNRHIKDILRSYCHEITHHMQWLENPDYIRRVFKADQDDVESNEELENVEGEAYLKGNLLFRKFTEKFKKDMQNNNDV